MTEEPKQLGSLDLNIKDKFPDALFNELNRLSGGIKWSMDEPNLLNAESVVAIMPFLRNEKSVTVVEDGDLDEDRYRVTIIVNGEIFKIYGKKEREERNVPDTAFLPNLNKLRDYLNNPQAKVLYIGSNSDRSAKEVFDNNAINLDMQGDRLSPGDVKADATKTPFRDGAFDLVVLKNSYDIIRNSELRREIYRILKNGGILFYAANTNALYEKGRNLEIDEDRQSTKAGIDKVYLEGDSTRFESLDMPEMVFAEDMNVLKAVKILE